MSNNSISLTFLHIIVFFKEGTSKPIQLYIFHVDTVNANLVF